MQRIETEYQQNILPQAKLNFLLFFNLGCSTTHNQKNYNRCIDKLEEERQKVRVGDGFSYKAPNYEECRAPARFSLDSD